MLRRSFLLPLALAFIAFGYTRLPVASTTAAQPWGYGSGARHRAVDAHPKKPAIVLVVQRLAKGCCKTPFLQWRLLGAART
jgi:hypothetical protein